MNQDHQSVDPALAELLGELESRRASPPSRPVVAEKPLPSRREIKREKERRKIKQRLPNRATYDLPVGMKQEIADIAEVNGTTASQVAALLLYYGLDLLDSGQINLDAHRVPSESLRYDWNLLI